jgi:hypothetical protein
MTGSMELSMKEFHTFERLFEGFESEGVWLGMS